MSPAQLSYGPVHRGGVLVDDELVGGELLEVVACSCGWEHELGTDRDGDNDIVLQHLAAEHPG